MKFRISFCGPICLFDCTMWTANTFSPGLLLFLGAVTFSPSTQAADISGAWAGDASVCSKVFVKNNSRVSFTPDSELYGGGLIIEGNLASGTFQKCTIKSMKDDGANIHLTAACSSGVMVSDLQFIVRFVGDNQITLSSVGPVDTETPYVRCSP